MKVLIFFLINEIKWTIAIINVTLAKNGIWNGMKSELILLEINWCQREKPKYEENSIKLKRKFAPFEPESRVLNNSFL